MKTGAQPFSQPSVLFAVMTRRNTLLFPCHVGVKDYMRVPFDHGSLKAQLVDIVVLYAEGRSYQFNSGDTTLHIPEGSYLFTFLYVCYERQFGCYAALD